MSQASVCHHDLFPRFTILNKKVLQRPTTTFCIIWRKKKKKNLTRVWCEWLGVCDCVSSEKREAAGDFLWTLCSDGYDSGDKQHKREKWRNVNLLSVTYLIAQKFWWMDRPVIWDLLRQAKVSHHSWAHAALPAHQAVLHRGVRGHTHTKHITFTASTCVFIPVFIAALFVFKQWRQIQIVPSSYICL